MKNIKAFAIVITAVCGLHFTSGAQTTTQETDASKTQSQTQTSQQQSDDISLGTSPTIEKSSQGYKVQVWVEPDTDINADFDRETDNMNRDLNRETDNMNRDINRETEQMNRDLNRDTDKWDQNKKIGTESDKTFDKNKSNTGSDDLKSPSTSTTGTNGTFGTTGTTGTTANDPSVIGAGSNLESSTTPAQSANAGTVRTSSDNAWQQSDQSTALNNIDKSKVVVKVIDESTGEEVKADDIEMKVTTPSKKSFTTDLKEKANRHEGELALSEEGTYNIQATIKTDDKNVVIPMEYENKGDHSSDKSFDKNYDTEKK